MSKNKGLRIGSYRIQPLGLTVLIVLLLIAVAAVVVFAVNPGKHLTGKHLTGKHLTGKRQGTINQRGQILHGSGPAD